MKKLYSTDNVMSTLNKVISKNDIARVLVGVGWKIDTLNIYDDGVCAELTLSNENYDKLVDFSVECEANTEYLVRSILPNEVAEKLIYESKTTWTFLTSVNDKEAA
jgi:hypothetical protein